MPRDGAGNYTLPSGINPVVDNTIIASTWANPTLADIAVQLNNVVTRDGVLPVNLPFKLIDGTVAAPSLSFQTDGSSGIYKEAAGVVSFSILGVKSVGIIAQGISAPLGAVGTPSFAITDNLSTGMWSPAANTLAWSNGGVEKARLGATGFEMPLGAVATPAYSFAGDLNTGMWSSAADTIAWSTGGVERLRIGTTGLAGFNTTGTVSSEFNGPAVTGSYSQWSVTGTPYGFIGNSAILVTGGLVSDFAFRAANAMVWSIGTTQAMRLDGAGNFGLGGTPNVFGAGTVDFTINASGTPVLDLNVAGVRTASLIANSTEVRLQGLTNLPFTFFQNTLERMRLDTTSGGLMIGRTAAGFSSTKFWVNQATNKNVAAYYNGGNAGIAAFDDSGAFITMKVSGAGVNISGDSGVTATLQITTGNVIQDSAGNELGTRRLLSASITTGTPVASDSAKVIYMSAAVTIPNAVFTTGDTLILQNNTGGALAVNQGVGLTLTWTSTAGSGTRSIKALGRASILFGSGSGAFISGDLT